MHDSQIPLPASRQSSHGWLLSKGQIPISDDRFIESIEGSQSSPLLIGKIKGRRLSASIWGGLSLSTLIGYSAAGAHMAASGFTRLPEDEDGNRRYRDSTSGYIGYGAIVAGAVTSAVLLLPSLRSFPEDPADGRMKPFTFEEAQDAIDGYNKWVAGKK